MRLEPLRSAGSAVSLRSRRVYSAPEDAVEFHDAIRLVLVFQETGVALLYLSAGIRFWVCRHVLGSRAEGRPAGIAGLICLTALSVKQEFDTWGQPLTFVEPLQLSAVICLFWLWWKVLGVVKWKQRRPDRNKSHPMNLV